MSDTITNDEALAMIAKGHAALTANLAKVEPPKPVEPVPDPQPPTVPVTQVATLAALTAALKAAKAGEVIELAAGDHGALSLKGIIAPGVTVRGAGAKVTGLQLNACEGITFEGLSADLAAGGAVKLTGCKDIGLTRLSSRNAKLYGVSILRSQGVQVRDCDIADVKDGVQGANSRGVLVQGCKIRRFRADGINMCGVSDLKVIGNDIADSVAGPTAHPDGIQLQTGTVAEAPAENIEIRGNKIRRGTGAIFQGVFITDQTDRLRYSNVLIADNDIEGSMYNGIAVSSTDDLIIKGNRVQPYSDMKSWIRFSNCNRVLLDGNAYAQLLIEEGVTGLDRRDTATLSAIAPR